MTGPSPFRSSSASLGVFQARLDLEQLSKKGEWLARKWERMTASPFGFLRGSARMFDEALGREPGLGRGPAGEGQLVGDLHLENFGTLRTAKGWVFQVNDFDEVRNGPWHHDLLRLLTSVLLARPELRISGLRTLQLCQAILEGHQRGLRGGKVPGSQPIALVLREAKVATAEKLLKKHVAGPRRLLRDEKHFDAPESLRKHVPSLVLRWASSLVEPPSPEKLKVLDVVRRLAGTGSLGVERLLVMTEGGGHPWLLDVKASPGGSAPVVEAIRKALPSPPLWLASMELAGQSVLVRRMEAGENRLELVTLADGALDATMRQLGALTGEVHRRLASSSVKGWKDRDLELILENARQLAGIHHHAYLDFCAEVEASGVLKSRSLRV